MGERVLLFANPIAGRGRGLATAQRVEKGLQSAGFFVETILKKASEIPTSELAGAMRDAVAAVSVGGDGTLRGVAGRLIDAAAEAADDSRSQKIPPLLIVPLGTANLMGKHLGIDWHRRDVGARVADAIRKRTVRHVDVGRANGKLFFLVVGAGIDGHIVHALSSVRKGPIDLTSYLLPAAFALRDYAYPALSVDVDGQRVFGPAPSIAFVGNIREYGTGFAILPDARSDDGLLDVCVMPCANRMQLVNLLMHAVASKHRDVEGVIYLTGKHIRIESEQDVPVQVDGEAEGHAPVVCDLMAVRLGFVVP